jgi:pimeloyl-ACP methyl ester carboxylesterase
VHGWGRNVGRVLPYIDVLHHAGFNVLAFDSRNHGSSDSDRYSTMLKFAQDIKAAVDFLEKSYKNSIITLGVVGLSIGGGAALYAASIDTRIMKLVTVGALGDPKAVIQSELKRNGIASKIIQKLLLRYLEHHVGISFEDLAPINRIKNIQAEVMIIHGEDDEVVPARQAHQLVENGNSEQIRLWLMPGKGHSNCHEHPEFWKSIKDFFSY